jgi:hypothetical protein
VTPYTLRHPFASTAEDLGQTIPTIRALIGHSGGGDATSRYIHKLDATLIAAADRGCGVDRKSDGRVTMRIGIVASLASAAVLGILWNFAPAVAASIPVWWAIQPVPSVRLHPLD